MKQHNENRQMEIFNKFNASMQKFHLDQHECYLTPKKSESFEKIKNEYTVNYFSASMNLRATPEKFIDYICFKYFSFIFEKK